MNNFIEVIREALGGGPSPGDLVPGKWIRFSTNGRRDDTSGSCLIFPDMEGGVYFDWRREGISGTWQAKKDRTPEEKVAFNERVMAARAEAARLEQERRAECRARCAEIWCKAEGATDDHLYLIKKNVKPHSIKQFGGDLLIPVRDSEGTLHGLQKIKPDGDKRFEPGTAVSGHYHTIGNPNGKILIAEGYATAATIHEVTGLAVSCAFNAGNLKAVALAVREKYPDMEIIIAADDDYMTGCNPGRTKATAAAKAVNGSLTIPVFRDTRGQKDTDFNDLAQLSGPEAVRACIDNAVVPAEETSAEASPENQEAALEATIQRLAALPPLEYDRVRKEEADALGVRAATLDAAVKAGRKGEADDDLPFTVVEPWPQPINPSSLLTNIAATIQRFIVCAQEVAQAVALWVALTWFIAVVQVAPLAVITAPEKRCGKTLLLNLMGKLSARAVTASSVSPAALYRTIELWSPTFFIDEADACLKDNEELRGVLNSGHTRDSAFVIRCVGDNLTPTRFSTWGAKAISGIGHVADTLMDRAVVLELRRKLPHEKVERIRQAEPNLFGDLQSKLARFAEDYSDKVRQARPPLPDALNDRAQDNWEPLLAIALVAGDEWLKIATTAALKLSGGETTTQTIGTVLLADIQEVLEDRKIERIFTDELIKALCADDEKPWATYNRGKSISPRQIANKLKGYGVQSKTIRIGSDRAKGFERGQFKDAFCRYVSPEKNIVPNPPVSNRDTGQPSLLLDLRDFSSVTDKTLSREEKQRKPASALDCHLVTDRKPLSGDENIFSERKASETDLFKIDVPVEVA